MKPCEVQWCVGVAEDGSLYCEVHEHMVPEPERLTVRDVLGAIGRTGGFAFTGLAACSGVQFEAATRPFTTTEIAVNVLAWGVLIAAVIGTKGRK